MRLQRLCITLLLTSLLASLFRGRVFPFVAAEASRDSRRKMPRASQEWVQDAVIYQIWERAVFAERRFQLDNGGPRPD